MFLNSYGVAHRLHYIMEDGAARELRQESDTDELADRSLTEQATIHALQHRQVTKSSDSTGQSDGLRITVLLVVWEVG